MTALRTCAVALSALLSMCACAQTDAVSGAPIRVDGSSTVFPITQAAAAEFLKGTPNAAIADAFSGTTAGFEKFCAGRTDIQNASRPIRAAEDAMCTAHQVVYLELPVVYDGITVVVHPSNTWATSMTIGELKVLWQSAATGKITRWQQVRAEWPDREIHLLGPGPKSGTFDFFSEVVAGRSGDSRSDYLASEDDSVIVNGVMGDALALGYVGYDHFERHRNGLKGVAIDDGDDSVGVGPVEPSALNVRRGVYRPLRGRCSSTSTRQACRGRRWRSSSRATCGRRICSRQRPAPSLCARRITSWFAPDSRAARPDRRS